MPLGLNRRRARQLLLIAGAAAAAWAAYGGSPAHASDPSPLGGTLPPAAEAPAPTLQQLREQTAARHAAARERAQADLQRLHERNQARHEAARQRTQEWRERIATRHREYLEKIRCACAIDPPPDVAPELGPEPGEADDVPPESEGSPSDGAAVPVQQPDPAPGTPAPPAQDKPAAPAPPVEDIGWRDWDEWTDDMEVRWERRTAHVQQQWEDIPQSSAPVRAVIGATLATAVQFTVVPAVDLVTDLGRPAFQVLDRTLGPGVGALRPLTWGLRCATAWLTVPLEELLGGTVDTVRDTELLPRTLEPVLAVVVPTPMSAPGSGGGQPGDGLPAEPAPGQWPGQLPGPVSGGETGPQPASKSTDAQPGSTFSVSSSAGLSASTDDGSADSASDRDRRQPAPGEQPGVPAGSGGSGSGGAAGGALAAVLGGMVDLHLTAGRVVDHGDDRAVSHIGSVLTRPA